MSLKNLVKRCVLAVLSTAFLAAAPAANAAGTTPLSMVQQFDSSGHPLAGCLLYFYVAGTVATPQNAYADFGLTTPLPNPVQCDQSGRVPQHWLADGLIHIRLTDSVGTSVIDTTMQVLGPSSGGGGGGTVDPTTIFTTGDLKASYSTGPQAGFVRANGLTIGNTSSGASERANADTQALFVFLYNNDPNLVVSGGRSGNALADFNANKTIALPDWSGRALAFLDDMGSGPRGVLTSDFYGTSPTVLGAGGGSQSHVLAATELPTITSNGSNTIQVSGSNSFSASGVNSLNLTGVNHISVAGVTNTAASQGYVPGTTGGGSFNFVGINASGVLFLTASGDNNISVSGNPTISVSGTVGINSSGSNNVSVSSNNTSGAAHPTVTPERLATLYIKL